MNIHAQPGLCPIPSIWMIAAESNPENADADARAECMMAILPADIESKCVALSSQQAIPNL